MKRRSVFLSILLGLLISAGVGYFSFTPKNPYQLNYNRATINLPISYSKYLNDKTYALGEKYLAEDFAKQLSQFGVETRLFTFEETLSVHDFFNGIEFYMRSGPELRLDGYHNYFDHDKISVLIETIPYELNEVKNADIVFTGSQRQNEKYRQLGINSFFLPQFTRIDKFYFAPRDDLKRKILYVANQWTKLDVRKTIKFAKSANIPIDVFGSNWSASLDGEYASWWKAKQIPNEELKYYYSSADIVLNDTRQDMIDAGFISNRIFDATACGAFVISDYIPEIEEIYGDAIPMYKNEYEFKQLIEYYLAHPDERKSKALKAQKITRENFSAQKIVAKMLDIIRDYRKQKGLD